jgi:hypothetical protein
LARRAPLRLAALAVAGLLLITLAAAATAEVAQKNGLIVSFGGSIAPRILPRTGAAPIGVTVEGRVRTASGRLPPALRRLSLELNANGVLNRRGLPTCRAADLQPSSSAQALATCGPARVGGGRVSGRIVIPEQHPTSFSGRVIAFNGHDPGGGPAILAHLYTKSPIALTAVIVFKVEQAVGTYGTRLIAVVPPRIRRLVHITSFKLRLGRQFKMNGQQRSYLSAGCPAAPGFPSATFPLVRASYGFVGGTTLRSVITRTCQARS